MVSATDAAPDRAAILGRGLAALVTANAVNVAIVAAAGAMALAPGFAPLAVSRVAVFTTLGVIGAVGTYGLLARLVDDHDRTFVVVAAVVLVLSLVPDVVLLQKDPAATVAGVVALMVMHVVAAVACVAALTGRIGLVEERLD